MSLDYYGAADDSPDDSAAGDSEELQRPTKGGPEQRRVLAHRLGPVTSFLFDGQRRLGVLVGHPHPLMGGSCDNNVVLAVVGQLQLRGISTIRFNFRHVECGPQDHTALAAAHIPDLLAAHAALAKVSDRVAWVGYSYSTGIMAQAAAADPELASQLAMRCYISPPNLFMNDVDWFSNPSVQSRVHMIAGSRDDFSNLGSIAVLDSSSCTKEVVEGEDHFWHSGQDAVLGEKVADIIEQTFSKTRL